MREWFTSRFGTPTEPQEQGWPHIVAGQTTLISAPTGSGKTLAAFLACINKLVCKALDGDLHDRTEVLYISPLKALGNDIQKNLEVPLGEILQMASERGLLMPQIRTAVRTGDTLLHERRAMLKRPPHILVTTPESLYILLTAESSRRILGSRAGRNHRLRRDRRQPRSGPAELATAAGYPAGSHDLRRTRACRWTHARDRGRSRCAADQPRPDVALCGRHP